MFFRKSGFSKPSVDMFIKDQGGNAFLLGIIYINNFVTPCEHRNLCSLGETYLCFAWAGFYLNSQLAAQFTLNLKIICGILYGSKL